MPMNSELNSNYQLNFVRCAEKLLSIFGVIFQAEEFEEKCSMFIIFQKQQKQLGFFRVSEFVIRIR